MAEGGRPLKPIVWIGPSRRELCALPPSVRREVGFALFLAQEGNRHDTVKTLKGFGGAGVLEVVENDAGGAYRAVYTVRFAGVVYVLHAFQKKSKAGIQTPKPHLNLIRQRLATAEAHYAENRHAYQTDKKE